MVYRLSEKDYVRIYNDPKNIKSIENLSYDLLIDIMCDIVDSPYISNDYECNLDTLRPLDKEAERRHIEE